MFGHVLAFAGGRELTDSPWLKVETFNFGAGGMTRTEFPGAHCVTSTAERRSTGGVPGLWLGKRRLQYIVPLERLLADSEALPAMSGEVIDELERRVP